MQNECHPCRYWGLFGSLKWYQEEPPKLWPGPTLRCLPPAGVLLRTGSGGQQGSPESRMLEQMKPREAPAGTWVQCGSKSTCSVHCWLARGLRELTFPLALHIWGDSKVPSHCFGVVIAQWPCGQYGRGISSAVSSQYLQGRVLGFICFRQGFFFPFCHFSFCNINCSPRSWHSF